MKNIEDRIGLFLTEAFSDIKRKEAEAKDVAKSYKGSIVYLIDDIDEDSGEKCQRWVSKKEAKGKEIHGVGVDSPKGLHKIK